MESGSIHSDKEIKTGKPIDTFRDQLNEEIKLWSQCLWFREKDKDK